MRRAWEGLGLMSGHKKVKGATLSTNTTDYVNERNHFYARFDSRDFSEERRRVTETLLTTLPAGEEADVISVTEHQVMKELKRCKPNKAAEPDNVKPLVLKLCAEQLCTILTYILTCLCFSAKCQLCGKCHASSQFPENIL
ncbi:hypothetical protein BaRGS_00016041 [Batillaria attramentaria]|uniref:Uncharacterized protein n=1 Tax=Batillaria attramentaria TaxID=370345 RepID=A0ABD0L049_9CAEN